MYAIKYHALLSIMYCNDGRLRQVLTDELTALLEMMDEPIAGKDRVTRL